jgi:hypothetical protein
MMKKMLKQVSGGGLMGRGLPKMGFPIGLGRGKKG